MYKVLYREYRPETFKAVLGQEHIIKILKNQIKTGEVNHAYLFCGTRGTGKTTMARLLAKGVNCLSDGEKPCGQCDNCKAIKAGAFMDLIEIDAASNNGVDNIRELRESVNFPPVSGEKKVYIVDEVHMLTTSAFNALLKTLEEPPENVMFILATTEPEKLPATILSRCMRMDFRRVSENILFERMSEICKDKGVEIEEEALRLVVSNADGSVRDGLTILDQCISTGDSHVSRNDVLETLGAVSQEIYLDLTEAVLQHSPTDILLTINNLVEDGKDSRQILQGWMSHYRSLLMVKFLKKPENVLNLSLENIEKIKSQAEEIELENISHAIMSISKAVADAKLSTHPRILLEICGVKLASESLEGTTFVPKAKAPVREVTIEPAKEVSMPKEQENKPTAKNGEKEDISGLWTAVVEAGEKEVGGNFMIVRNNASLLSATGEDFYISARGIALAFLEREKKYVEGLMEKLSGKSWIMNLVDEDKEKKEDVNAEDIASNVENLLGINVEVE